MAVAIPEEGIEEEKSTTTDLDKTMETEAETETEMETEMVKEKDLPEKLTERPLKNVVITR